MIQRLLAGATLLAVLGLSALPEAQATTLSALTVEQMTDASDLVVRGVVTEVWAEEDDKGRIWTHAQVEVSQVFKGDTQTRSVIVDQMGGVLGENTMIIAEATRFSVGEEAYFFLETLGSGHTVTVGMFQGKFTVRQEPYTGDEMVLRFRVPQSRPYDHRFIPHPEESQRVYAPELEEAIVERVELGWDGQPIPGASPEKLRRVNKLQPGVK
ncbi:MAG: hypothetical protein H6741_22625 [Alphaproteobacteria bacterium]|nr:hypothetical protein [Alphaproteobacteria bacterium]